MREINFNFAKLFLGLFLIFLGLIYLAKTTGFLDIEFNLSLFQLWPIIIIFIGLSLLSHRGWLSLIISAVVTLIVFGTVAFMIVTNQNRSPKEETILIKHEAGVKTAVLDLRTGAGKLKISGEGKNLVDGKFESNLTELSQKSEVQNETQNIELKMKGKTTWAIFGRNVNELDLQLNPDILFKLSLDTGAIDGDLDLSNLNVEAVDIDTGASNLDLTFGDKVKVTNVSLNAGASSINITLPKTVGAKVNVTSGLSSKNLAEFKQIDPNTFESNNYATAEKKITLNLVLGVSSLNVNWR